MWAPFLSRRVSLPFVASSSCVCGGLLLRLWRAPLPFVVSLSNHERDEHAKFEKFPLCCRYGSTGSPRTDVVFASQNSPLARSARPTFNETFNTNFTDTFNTDVHSDIQHYAPRHITSTHV